MDRPGLRFRNQIGPIALAVLATLMAFPATGLATAPGPPDVEVVPPVVIHTERGDEPVTFVPGQITFTFTDGSTSECVIDPPCRPARAAS